MSIRARITRAMVVMALPLTVAAFTYQSWIPVFSEPIEFLAYHPAPPAVITVYSLEDFRK